MRPGVPSEYPRAASSPTAAKARNIIPDQKSFGARIVMRPSFETPPPLPPPRAGEGGVGVPQDAGRMTGGNNINSPHSEERGHRVRALRGPMMNSAARLEPWPRWQGWIIPL